MSEIELKEFSVKDNNVSLGGLNMGVQQVGGGGGGGITQETDPTVPQWAKQPNKPTYDYSEINNTPDLTVYAKKTEVEKEIELAKTEAKDWATAEATAMRNEAKVYTDQKFNGANKAVAFTNYSALCTALNNDSQAPQYSVGQNIYIQTLNVPDLWVRNVSEMYNYYIYNTDEDFINKLNEKGYVQVGFYLLSALETQKVDLIDYAKTEYVDEKAATAIVTAENNAKEYTDQKIGDIERTIDGIIGDISTALDELHTYAQSLINGGVSQ